MPYRCLAVAELEGSISEGTAQAGFGEPSLPPSLRPVLERQGVGLKGGVQRALGAIEGKQLKVPELQSPLQPQ